MESESQNNDKTSLPLQQTILPEMPSKKGRDGWTTESDGVTVRREHFKITDDILRVRSNYPEQCYYLPRVVFDHFGESFQCKPTPSALRS